MPREGLSWRTLFPTPPTSSSPIHDRHRHAYGACIICFGEIVAGYLTTTSAFGMAVPGRGDHRREALEAPALPGVQRGHQIDIAI